jgi:hypothetical protein
MRLCKHLDLLLGRCHLICIFGYVKVDKELMFSLRACEKLLLLLQ